MTNKTKNFFTFLSVFVVVVLLLSTSLVYAENEVANTDPTSVTTENTSTSTTNTENTTANPSEGNTTSEINTNTNFDPQSNTSSDSSASKEENEETNPATSENNFTQEDVYLIGDNVTIDNIVDGNLFIIANQVTINSQIGGDAFIMAKSLLIGEQGYIYSNLFAGANHVDIRGVVYDLYTFAENVTISGYVYRDMRTSCSNLNIFGIVGRNAYVNAKNIRFTSEVTMNSEDAQTVNAQGKISGNFNYSSPSEVSFPEGSVNGNINYNKESGENKISTYMISLGTIVASAIIIWLLGNWLTPKYIQSTHQLLTKKWLPLLGIGLFTPFVLILLSTFLLVLKITASFGLLLLAFIFILMGISTSIFIITINNMICNQLKINKNIGIFGMLIISSIAIWAIGLIPYVGSILGIVAIVIGLGLIMTPILRKNKTTEKQNVSNLEN